jgi:hypothetical protein
MPVIDVGRDSKAAVDVEPIFEYFSRILLMETGTVHQVSTSRREHG